MTTEQISVVVEYLKRIAEALEAQCPKKVEEKEPKKSAVRTA